MATDRYHNNIGLNGYFAKHQLSIFDIFRRILVVRGWWLPAKMSGLRPVRFCVSGVVCLLSPVYVIISH
jgi:hypothetical protein